MFSQPEKRENILDYDKTEKGGGEQTIKPLIYMSSIRKFIE